MNHETVRQYKAIIKCCSIIPNKILLEGQTDIHFSKEGKFQLWNGYVMRKRAPFKENIDIW